MVGVLGIIAALTVYLSDDLIKEGNTAHALLIVFSTLGLMLAGGWGSFTVLTSINSEVAERTWDQQRLSALSPWQMAWGKLLGASIYPWFGGLICAAVVLASGLMLPNGNMPRLILLLLSGIVGCLALHCWIMASLLHTMDARTADGETSTVKRLLGLFILLQFAPSMLLGIVGLGAYNAQQSLIVWWALAFGLFAPEFAHELPGPGAGPAGTLAQHVYPADGAHHALGLGRGLHRRRADCGGLCQRAANPLLWPALVAGVAWVATYFALFTEKTMAWFGAP